MKQPLSVPRLCAYKLHCLDIRRLRQHFLVVDASIDKMSTFCC